MGDRLKLKLGDRLYPAGQRKERTDLIDFFLCNINLNENRVFIQLLILIQKVLKFKETYFLSTYFYIYSIQSLKTIMLMFMLIFVLSQNI